MLRIENLSVSIQSVQILRDISLVLPEGSMTGLIGRNGAGKTTLMKSIMGILKVSSGSIRFNDADLLATPTWRLTRMGIGYMPEDRRLIPDLTAIAFAGRDETPTLAECFTRVAAGALSPATRSGKALLGAARLRQCA